MVRKPHQPRFVRLSAQHAAALLGGTELEPWMIISGGRFVARQRISMVGPGGRIDGVAVVGPVVQETIVSLADRDEERLGLPAGAQRDVLLVGPSGEARVLLPA
ncbi:MAG: hypothetical protein RMK29_00890 [Myxococcales bacterium]|nr:hypothetical protein [Myxococcota bacterium]MDW8280234.1 hypothetical protein [Myxococcales bacterium]